MSGTPLPHGLDSGDPDYDISDAAVMEALRQAEDRHFWQRSRARLIATRLRRLGLLRGSRFLELGCGMGRVAMELVRAGYRVTGVDGHQPLVNVASRRCAGATFLVRDLRQGIGDLGDGSWDAVGLFDVIEHLAQPAAAMEGALACVKPAGLLVGTVPALMSLWSSIDEQAGHKIRYDRRSLSDVLQVVRGADVIEIAPFNRLLVPMLWLHRRAFGKSKRKLEPVDDLAVPAAALNFALYALLRAEAGLAPLLDRTDLSGASLWFALRKRT